MRGMSRETGGERDDRSSLHPVVVVIGRIMKRDEHKVTNNKRLLTRVRETAGAVRGAKQFNLVSKEQIIDRK